MKFRIERDALAEAVAWVARSLPTRPAVPILAGLLIQASQGQVVLSAFDYETSAKITVKADIQEQGEALVSGRLLSDICRSLPSKPVDIAADESSMELVCGLARFTLQTLPVAEYPQLPDMPQATGEIASQDFAQGVAQVVVAAGRDELLPVFTGVRVEIEGETLSLLATDRYRMALKEMTWRPTSPSIAGAALVPARVLNETAKSMTSGEAVTMSLADPDSGDGLIGFDGAGTAGEREITTRLLDGEFPKLRHFLSMDPLVTVRVSTAEILASVKRIALVAERNTPLRILIHDDQITLEAAQGDQAQGVEALQAVVAHHGEEEGLDKAGFNPHYLQDALTAMDTPFVELSFTKPGRPCLLMGLADIAAEPVQNYRHVIMLMRLPD
ncbi:MAG: DNA polymerase III subunit beta [Propionibacteriaceae bacterium]